MSTKIYYFSATGNSLYLSKRLCEELKEGEIFSIPKIIDNEITLEGERIGIVYPIHCGSLPIVVEEFLKKVKIKGNPYIFAVGVTGGGGADLSFKHINKLLIGKGELSNFFTVKYISNYIRAGRNVTEERVKEVLKGNEPIIYDIYGSVKNREIKHIGNKLGADFIMYKLWRDGFRNKDKAFYVNEDCISCGICGSVCPTNNVILKDGKPTWNKKCTDCMACINLCPKSAINLGKKTIKKGRYMNPKVTVKELEIRSHL